jgi:hypothetical protein
LDRKIEAFLQYRRVIRIAVVGSDELARATGFCPPTLIVRTSIDIVLCGPWACGSIARQRLFP